MEKTDLIRSDKAYYTAAKHPVLLDIGPAQYISLTGRGDPSGELFNSHIQALYQVAYGLKFLFKEKKKDFAVAKLEGLWWFDEKKYSGISMTDAPALVPRSEWEYRLMIRIPDFVSQWEVSEVIRLLNNKQKPPLAGQVSLFGMEEGKCVQVLHVGPYYAELKSLESLRVFMESTGLEKNGLHHEIYLSDARRTPPEKLRTILREPVKQT